VNLMNSLLKVASTLRSSADLKTSELPANVRDEALATLDVSEEDIIVWRRDQVDPFVAGDMVRDFFQAEPLKRLEGLLKSVRKVGFRRPVVIGPHGIEGNHRLQVGYLLRIPVPAWIAYFPDAEESKDWAIFR